MESHIICSRNRRHNIFEKSILPKLMNWFSATNQNCNRDFAEINEMNYMEIQRTQNSQNKCFKKQSWRTYPTWFQDRGKDRQTIIYIHKYINRTEESPKIDLHIFGYLIFNKSAKSIQWGMYSLFNKQC